MGTRPGRGPVGSQTGGHPDPGPAASRTVRATGLDGWSLGPEPQVLHCDSRRETQGFPGGSSKGGLSVAVGELRAQRTAYWAP